MKNITVEMLEKFCEDDGYNNQIGKPFKQGDYIHSTNSHIAIRVKYNDSLSEVVERTSPSMSNIYTNLDTRIDVDVLSFFNSLENDKKEEEEEEEPECNCIECPACDGFGYVDVDVEYYNPKTGRYEEKNVDYIDCPVCDSINDDCPVHGNGKKYNCHNVNPIKFNDKEFNKDYLLLIKETIGADCEVYSNNEKQYIYLFKNEIAEILLMCRRS